MSYFVLYIVYAILDAVTTLSERIEKRVQVFIVSRKMIH